MYDNKHRKEFTDRSNGRHYVHDSSGNRLYFGSDGNYEQNIHITPTKSQSTTDWIASKAKDIWNGTVGLIGDIIDYNKEYNSDYKTYPGSRVQVKKTAEDKQQGYWSGLGELNQRWAKKHPIGNQGVGQVIQILLILMKFLNGCMTGETKMASDLIKLSYAWGKIRA